jgi:hypothetical protein
MNNIRYIRGRKSLGRPTGKEKSRRKNTIKLFLRSEIMFSFKQATNHAQLHALMLQKVVLNIVCTDLQGRPEFCILKSQKGF